MENNSTQTAKKPTAREMLQIFCQYVGGVVETRYLEQDLLMISVGASGLDFPVVYFHFAESSLPNVPLHRAKLLLKPLSKISDEDALWVIKTCQHFNDDPAYGKKIVEQLCDQLQNTLIKGRAWWQIIDYLRSRGYALPYGQWSVEELVEFGIFKLTE